MQLAVGESHDVCGVARLRERKTVLQWTEWALRVSEDAGANLVVRQAPLTEGVHHVGAPSLDGLPGFLADSLPDAWGRLLMDRRLREHGINHRMLSGVDRLALIGARGPGALAFRPEYDVLEDATSRLDLDELAWGAELLLAGESPEVLAQLEHAGGSAGGSRPKVWVAESPAGTLRSGAHLLENDEVGWLIKFRAPRYDPVDVGPSEYAYAQMAMQAGLIVAEPRLFETSRGRYFGSRRFDRKGDTRIHVLTAAGLLNVAADRAMAADYVDLLKLTRMVTRSEAEVLSAFRHSVFNVLSHNRDDHLRQFAFVRGPNGWTRSPVYDVTYSSGPGGEHTLLVSGEGRMPTVEHLTEVGRRAGLRPARVTRVIDEVREAVLNWGNCASEAGVSEATTAQVDRAIRQCIAWAGLL